MKKKKKKKKKKKMMKTMIHNQRTDFIFRNGNQIKTFNRSHIIRRKSKMINKDSKNALSMMKFDMEIAKT